MVGVVVKFLAWFVRCYDDIDDIDDMTCVEQVDKLLTQESCDMMICVDK